MTQNNNNTDGKEYLKQIVKDEVARQIASSTTNNVPDAVTSVQTQRPSSIQSIVQRARNLIQSNTSSAQSPAVQNSHPFQPPKRRKISSRSYLPPPKKEAPAEVKTFELVLLRSANYVQDDGTAPDVIPDYSKSEEDVCCTGMVDISTDADERSIRLSIQEVLVNRIPDFLCEDFDFVKVKGKKVTTPVFKKGQDLGYKQLKALAGQGAVYVRLRNKLVQSEANTASNSEDVQIIDSNDAPLDVASTYISSKKGYQPSCTGASVSTSSQHPRLSCMSSVSNLDQLKQMFPNHEATYLEGVLLESDSVHDAISKILSAQDVAGGSREEEDDDDELRHSPFDTGAPSPDEPLKKYRAQAKVARGKQHVSFNRFQMSAFRQLMRLMKDPNLDLRKEPDIMFEGELGADLGGPKKEFFSRAMQSLVDVDQAYKIQLFGGLEDHRVPLYNVDAISEGCFTMAGKLLAWSVLHNGEGLVGLAPAVVEYLSTGSASKAACKVTIDDVCDLELKDIIEKVLSHDISELSSDEQDKIEGRMVGHGLNDIPITNLNKEKAMKDILIAEVVITRVLAMDKFYEGLDCMGLGKLLRNYPTLIGPLIFPSTSDVSVHPDQVRAKSSNVDYDRSCDEEKNAVQWYHTFIQESAELNDKDIGKTYLQLLVKFVTGGWQVICKDEWKVSFVEGPLLESESCFNKVYLPTCHASYSDFKKACLTSFKYGAEGYGKF